MSKKITTFLNDPEVGALYWADALKKYENMTALEMIDLLAGEVGMEIQTFAMNETLYRIYHTLQTISDKLKQGE